MSREFRRMLWRVDALGLRIEWRRFGDDVECFREGMPDRVGFGATWSAALADLLGKLEGP